MLEDILYFIKQEIADIWQEIKETFSREGW